MTWLNSDNESELIRSDALQWDLSQVSTMIISNLETEVVATFKDGVKIPCHQDYTFGDKNGVYVVKKYNIPYNTRYRYDSYIPYTKTNITNEQVKKALLNIYEGNTQTSYFAIQSFVSVDDLMLHRDVLLLEYDILITFNRFDGRYPDDKHVVNDSTVQYLIVDTNRPNTEHYINIGGAIMSVFSKTSRIKDGIYIWYKDGDRTLKVQKPLSVAKELGIYTNRHEAITNGYLADRMNLRKLEAEIEHMETTIETKEKLLKENAIKNMMEVKLKQEIIKDQLLLNEKKSRIDSVKTDKSLLGTGFTLVGDAINIVNKHL